LFLQLRQAFHKFVARQNGGRRHGDVFLRLVPLHQLQFPALRFISAFSITLLLAANWSLMAFTGGGFIRCRWPIRFSITRAWPHASSVFTLFIFA
jgi:hypothetical protein